MYIGRAVTVAPATPARAVEAPAIRELLSLRTGRTIDAPSLIRRHRYDALIRLRHLVFDAWKAGRPRVHCAICGVPAYLVSSTKKAFFFRHVAEDGSCPAITRDFGPEDDLRARKYAGLPESEPHRRLKHLLMRSIAADPAFEDGAEEAHWRANVKGLGRRRPDVSARRGDLRIAFEAQLSTTFLSVIAGRRAFYRAEGALLVWVLASFDPDHRRMTEDDIVFPNNSNALVVDEETAAQSEARGRFRIRCWHPVPGAKDEWRSSIINFAELTLDTEGQRTFLVDIVGEQAARRARAQAEEVARIAQAQEAARAHDEDLRGTFLAYWRTPWPKGGIEMRLAAWARFHAEFAGRGLALPSYEGDRDLDRWLSMVFTAQTGTPEGWNYRALPEVAHHLHDKYPGLLTPFFHTLRFYEHYDTLVAQDVTGNWDAKARRTRQEIRNGSMRYDTTCEPADLLAFLFPELFHIFFNVA